MGKHGGPSPYFSGPQNTRLRLDLRVAVALADLVHDRGRANAGLDGVHLRGDAAFVEPGRRRDAGAIDSAALGAVAIGAGRNQALGVERLLAAGRHNGRRKQGRKRQTPSESPSAWP